MSPGSTGRAGSSYRLLGALGLKGGSKASIRLNGTRIVIEPVDEGLEKRVEEWRALTLGLRAKPFTGGGGGHLEVGEP